MVIPNDDELKDMISYLDENNIIKSLEVINTRESEDYTKKTISISVDSFTPQVDLLLNTIIEEYFADEVITRDRENEVQHWKFVTRENIK